MEATRRIPRQQRTAKKNKKRTFSAQEVAASLPEAIIDSYEIQEVPRNARGVWLGIEVGFGRMPFGFGDGSGVIGPVTNLFKPVDLTGLVGRFVNGHFVEDVSVLDEKHGRLTEFLGKNLNLSESEATEVAEIVFPREKLREKFFERQRAQAERACFPKCPIRARMGLSV